MKKAALVVVLGLVSVLLTDCIVGYPTFGPPALRAEVVVGRPGPGYVWMGGYYGWGSGRYYWVPGHWVRGRPGGNWVAGRWEPQGRRWVWRKGYWR